MKINTTELIVTGGLIATAVLLVNPFHFWMPTLMVVTILALLLVLFGCFASFVMRESTTDEREVQHRTHAGRTAFLAGAATLIVGIAIQGYAHTVDIWLVATLIVMILAKLATRIWSDRNL